MRHLTAPRYLEIENALEPAFALDLRSWLLNNTDKLEVGGDGHGRINHEIKSVDDHYGGMGPLRNALLEEREDAARECKMDDFDVSHVEMHAVLYHHRGFFHWHDDSPLPDGSFAKTRRLTFVYYLNSGPFTGGELEFHDGTLVKPRPNKLILFDPLQRHRVRKVECWSHAPEDGRWSVTGWLHGPAPEGHTQPPQAF